MKDKDNWKNERISIQANATIGSNGFSGDGLLIDFSSQGLGVLLDHNVDIGQKLKVLSLLLTFDMFWIVKDISSNLNFFNQSNYSLLNIFLTLSNPL